MTLGNKRQQRRNHRHNNRGVPRRDELYRTIDGNETYQPFAYCWYHSGYLTRNQSLRHRCNERKCSRFEPFEHHQKHIKEKYKN